MKNTLNGIQLESVLQRIYKAYKPKDIDTNKKVADIIVKQLNTKCTSRQIFIHRTSRSSDDFEREHRRIQYGYNYDTFNPDY